MLNRTFSIDKNRELSSLEARIGSIKRRLTNHLGGRSAKARVFPTNLQDYQAAMPKNRAQRKGRYWEPSETEETHGDRCGSRVGAGEGDERGNSNGDNRDNDIDNSNDRTNSISNESPHEGRGGASSHHEYQHSPSSWTQAVSGTVQSLGAAHRALNGLQKALTLHMDDLSKMEETQNRLKQVEEECRGKEGEIKRLENTVTTLTGLDQKAKAHMECQQAEIEREKKELGQEKTKQEKRVSLVMAEERLKLETEFNKLRTQHGKSHDEREKELEDEFTRRKEESSRRIAALEAEKRKIWAAAEEQKKTIEVQGTKLEEVTEQCDVLERAKDSVKKEKKDLEIEIETMRKEFALSHKSIGYFEQRFAAIYQSIEGIALKYFDTDLEDPEKVHEALVLADLCFSSVPIDDSDDSHNLLVAHSERVISDAICQYIWKPFGCEFTLSHPEFADLFCKISDEIYKSSQGGCTANVWTALTMRVLQSLPADWLPGASNPTESPTPSSRADCVISKVFSALSPLISSSVNTGLRTDLVELATMAIDVWNDAHNSELRIVVSPLLQCEHREEWRSQRFDPVLTPEDRDKTKQDILSRTHPRIFTLFPRVIAREVTNPVNHDKGPPGCWPLDLKQSPRTIETCIHPGRGLPEWSPLVVRGKEEQEEKKTYLSNAMETAKRELRRTTGHGRTGSKGSSILGPSSPTELWKKEGVMKYPD